MKLKIEITMDNAAFETDRAAETIRILKRLIDDVVADWPGASRWTVGLRDINGNPVGRATVK